jgi:Zn-dependent protease with chaperone function
MIDREISESNQPLSYLGLRLLAALATVFLTVAGLLLLSQMNGWFSSLWPARLLVVLGGAGFISYMLLRHQFGPDRLIADDVDAAYQRLSRSVQRVCEQAQIPALRARIVETPEFVLDLIGLRPESAVVVASRQVVEVVSEDRELDALVCRQISRVVHFDGLLTTVLSGPAYLVSGLAKLIQTATRPRTAQQPMFRELVQRGGTPALAGAIFLVFLAGYLIYAACQLTVTAVMCSVLLLAGLWILTAVLRERELLADRYAAERSAPESLAEGLLHLARADPRGRWSIGQRLGISGDPDSWSAVQVLDVLRAQPGRPSWIERVLTWFLPEAPLMLRLEQLSRPPSSSGKVETLVRAALQRIESWAGWLTPACRTQRARPLNREVAICVVGALVGVLAGFVAPLLPQGNAVPTAQRVEDSPRSPKSPRESGPRVRSGDSESGKKAEGDEPAEIAPDHSWLAGLAIAMPAGLILGAGVAVVLQRRGPFLGADLVDATVTAFAMWLVVAVGLSGALLVPGWASMLQWSWLVGLVSFAVSIAGYIALAPAYQAGATGVLAGALSMGAADSDPAIGATNSWPVVDEPLPTVDQPTEGLEAPVVAPPLPNATASATAESASESGPPNPDSDSSSEVMDADFLDEIQKRWSS